ncbi:hypothetical protein VKT23_014347 [Stygiomarasmius scandens]|uniref:Mid2 domain-containing protein n=1 Tax=Marasmiellus scandens TaxID=2682957 RepID=A0ABR1J2Y7_9AGAR
MTSIKFSLLTASTTITPDTSSITTPTSSITTPTSSITTPTSSITTPTSSITTPTSSITTPTSSITTPTSSITTPTSTTISNPIFISLSTVRASTSMSTTSPVITPGGVGQDRENGVEATATSEEPFSNGEATRKINPTGIIIGATLGSISFIIIVLFILLRWRRKHRGKSSHWKIGAVPYNIRHDATISRQEKAFAELAHIPDHGRQQGSERPRSRALSESDSTFTARQQNIRSEADDLRRQLRTIQRTQETMVTSNDINDLKSTLAVMMTHIQRLDRQFESDWARGLTDEAPPDYVMVARG